MEHQECQDGQVVDVHHLGATPTLDVDLVRVELDILEDDALVHWDAEDLLEYRDDPDPFRPFVIWALYVTQVHIIKVVDDHTLEKLGTLSVILAAFWKDTWILTDHVSFV